MTHAEMEAAIRKIVQDAAREAGGMLIDDFAQDYVERILAVEKIDEALAVLIKSETHAFCEEE